MNIVSLQNSTKEEALECLDSLREQLESGKIIAFAAVGIEPDDVTCYWQATTRKITRLRLIGATATLHNFVLNDG